MRYILLLMIRIYWLVPVRKRRTCLFNESCSNYVYNITRRFGLLMGLKALQKRFRTCRPGYRVIDGVKVRLADGSVMSAKRLRREIL